MAIDPSIPDPAQPGATQPVTQPATHGDPQAEPLPAARPAARPDAGPRGARGRIREAGHWFQADFYRGYLRRHPQDVGALAELGAALTRLGQYQEGLAIDRRLAELCPESPVVHYNLACSLALLGRPDEALAALETAVRCGYDDGPHLARDADLRSLRRNARFRSLLARLGGSESAQA